MRHDKDRYAGAAIEAAQAGKLVGDDVRILTFSAYAAGDRGCGIPARNQRSTRSRP